MGKDSSGNAQPLSVDYDGKLKLGGSSSYAEDSAYCSGDTGTPILTVRQDVSGSTVDCNGDYAMLQTDDQGRLRSHDEELREEIRFLRNDILALTTAINQLCKRSDANGDVRSRVNSFKLVV